MEFDFFWSLYPRKVGKGAARTAFARALKKATFKEIMDGVERLVNDRTLDLKYCPHPTTWLNQERWADESPAVPTATQSVTPMPPRFISEEAKNNTAVPMPANFRDMVFRRLAADLRAEQEK